MNILPPRCVPALPAAPHVWFFGGFFFFLSFFFSSPFFLSRSVSHCGSGLDEDLGENTGSGLPHLNAKPFNLFKQYFCSFPSLRKKESAPGAASDPGVSGPQAAAGGARAALRGILSPWELSGRFNILPTIKVELRRLLRGQASLPSHFPHPANFPAGFVEGRRRGGTGPAAPRTPRCPSSPCAHLPPERGSGGGQAEVADDYRYYRYSARQRVNSSLFPLILIPAWVGGSRCSDLLERKR